MSEVRRYVCQTGVIQCEPPGELVLASDYDALKAELDEWKSAAFCIAENVLPLGNYQMTAGDVRTAVLAAIEGIRAAHQPSAGPTIRQILETISRGSSAQEMRSVARDALRRLDYVPVIDSATDQTSVNQPFERIPQHSADPGFGPVPPPPGTSKSIQEEIARRTPQDAPK